MSSVVGSELPHVGKVELSWHASEGKAVTPSNGDRGVDTEFKMEIIDSSPTTRQDDKPLRDMDTYDEADDYDEFAG